VLSGLLKDGEGQQFLQVNRFQDILWYNGEALEELLRYLFLVAVIQSSAGPLRAPTQVEEEVLGHYRVILTLEQAGQKAEYQVEKLLEAAKG
jgi:hypothetical protein